MAEDIKNENETESASEESSEQESENSVDGLIQEEQPDPQDDQQISEESDATDNTDEPLTQEDDNTQEVNTNEENSEDAAPETEEVNTPIEVEDDIETDGEDHAIQQKQTKLQKILMITAGALGGILVLGFILYLFGAFDPEEPPKPQPIPTQENNQTKKPEKYIFDSKDINIDRLNNKLRILTKYEIIGTKEEEVQKQLEKNAKVSTQQIDEMLIKEQERLEEEKRKAEELKKAEEERIAQEAKKKEEEEKRKAEEARKAAQSPYDLLKFIQVNEDQSVLSAVKPELEKYGVKVSKCQDNGRDFLLIGPFKSNEDKNLIFRQLYKDISQNITKKDLARLEFDRVCK